MSQRVCELLSFPRESVPYALYLTARFVKNAGPMEMFRQTQFDNHRMAVMLCESLSARIRKVLWDFVELCCLLVYAEREDPDNRVIDACTDQENYFLQADILDDGIKIYLVNQHEEPKALPSDINVN